MVIDAEELIEYLNLKRRELLYHSSCLIDNDTTLAQANSNRGAYRELTKLVDILKQENIRAHSEQLSEKLKNKF
jgi:hypothetical protein